MLSSYLKNPTFFLHTLGLSRLCRFSLGFSGDACMVFAFNYCYLFLLLVFYTWLSYCPGLSIYVNPLISLISVVFLLVLKGNTWVFLPKENCGVKWPIYRGNKTMKKSYAINIFLYHCGNIQLKLH